MKRIVLLLAAFVVASMATQTVSHFVLATEHYAMIAHLRETPIFSLGVLAMLVQGTLLALCCSGSPADLLALARQFLRSTIAGPQISQISQITTG
jgi:hypothetical protein